MADTLTARQEHEQFYAAIGVGTTQWSHIEFALLQILHACLSKSEWGVVSAVFYGIENFRSKYSVVDRAILAHVVDPATLRIWTAEKTGLLARIVAASGIRNGLAHNTVLIFPQAKPGRRYNLRPNMHDPMKALPPVSTRPNGGWFLKELQAIPQTFGPLMRDLENYSQTLQGLPAHFPEPQTPLHGLPTKPRPSTPKRAGPPRPRRSSRA